MGKTGRLLVSILKGLVQIYDYLVPGLLFWRIHPGEICVFEVRKYDEAWESTD